MAVDFGAVLASLHISWVGPFSLLFSLLATIIFVKSNLYFVLHRACALDSGPLAGAGFAK
jgi:hypothetical protein